VHLRDEWVPALDLYPMDSLAMKRALTQEAVAKEILMFFEHDPAVAAGYLLEEDGTRRVVPALT
jgi:hypothetical protein